MTSKGKQRIAMLQSLLTGYSHAPQCTFLLLFLFGSVFHSLAASKDEQFTVDGVVYKVTDATNFYVTALGVANDNTLTEVDIPAQVKNNEERLP